MKYLTSGLLCFLLIPVWSQDLEIDGDAHITEELSAGSLLIEGNVANRIKSSSSTSLALHGPNPMLELLSNTDASLAFFQAFGSDLFLANRQNGNLILRTNNLNRMTINGAGDILMRTAARKGEITLTHANGSGTSGNGVAIEHSGSNDNYWNFYVSNVDGNLELSFKGDSKGVFNSVTGAYTATSDQRLKENIQPIGNKILDKVLKLKPSIYQFRSDDSNKNCIGLIAQEVEPLFPEVVSKGKIGDSMEELYTLDYSVMGVIAIAAIQELTETQQKENEQLRSENQLMQKQLDQLSYKLAQLESMLNNQIVSKN